MLKLMEIQKKYHKNRGLIHVSLSIFPGELYLFVGENGSGKSTTIKVISKVIFKDKNMGTISNDFKRMVYLPDKRGYPRLLTVKTYLEYFLEKVPKNLVLEAWLERYCIPNKKIGSLSKGMLQKLGILQTLLTEGDLYLLDEPTDGLDVESIRKFKEDILQLLQKKKTIIISTHNKALLKEVKPIIYTFKEGICYEKKQKST